MKELREKIQRFAELLAIEKDEDYKQYVAQFERCSIAERRRNGVTWYPLNIVAEELGAGDYLILEVERTQGQNELHQFSNGKLIELFSNSGDNNSENWKLHINYCNHYQF